MESPARHSPAHPSDTEFIERTDRGNGEPIEGPLTTAAALRDTAPVAYTPKHLADKILRSRSASEGERKQVTVMFADVSGFTAMSSRLDPEDVHDIMDRAFEVILDAVHRYEGTVNQFLGDGVMALFGAPIAHEDHAHRALRAALEIQDGLAAVRQDVRERHGVEFRIRMGINLGLVVVGAIGRDLRMDYTAIGDTTNLAARLLGIAQPGQIVVSSAVHRPTDGYFVFEDLGEHVVKGKDAPVHAYLVVEERRGRTRLDVSRDRGLTPLAGRRGQLDRLLAAHARVLAGKGAVVLVVGEAGAGKSRLLYEVMRRLEGTGVLELEATCVSHGHAMPYHPVIPLIRRALELDEDTAGDGLRQRVSQKLRALGFPDDEPAVLVAHFLGAQAPAEVLGRLGGAKVKERTHAVLSGLLGRLARERPVVAIVENLHWADPSSKELLVSLAATVAGSQALLLLTTRPGDVVPGLAEPNVEILQLEGLDPADVRGMARAILGAEQIAPALLEAVVAKAEGNPLYVEEVLNQLRETGGVAVDGGEAHLTAMDLLVPKSLHDIIAARIDRLPDDVKHALQVAAVLGREFSVPLLEHVLGDGAGLDGFLRDLQTLDLIFSVDSRIAPTFAFKHALIQEVAYAGLLERHRRHHHGLAGQALERLHHGRIDDVVGLVAHHFWRSGEHERAVDYAILAGEQAQRRWAQREALEHFGRALERLERMPDDEPNRRRRIDAVVRQSEIKFALGRHAEHVQALEAIRSVVESSADPPRRAAWSCWTGFLHSLTGARPEIPIAHCLEAVRIAEAEGLEEIRAIALCCLSHTFTVAGRLREALAAGEQAVAVFEARGNVWWACRALWCLSMAANASGQWTRGLAYCRQGLDHGEALNDLRLKVTGWLRTGSTYVQQGIPAAGLRCCDEALALSPIPFDEAMVKVVRGYALVKAGQVAEGTAALAEMLAWFDHSQLRYTRASVATFLAEAYARGGDRQRARAVADEVLAASGDAGYRYLEAVAERLLGETVDDPEAADAHLARAAALAEDIGAENELARAMAARALRWHERGDGERAREELVLALAIFEALGTVDEIARVQNALTEQGPPPSPS